MFDSIFPACLWKRRAKIMPSTSLCMLWIIVPHSFLNHTTQIGKLLGNSCFQRSPWPSPKTWMSSSTGLGGREVCTEHASSSSASDTFGTVAKQSSGEGAFMCWKWGLVFLSWYHSPLYPVILTKMRDPDPLVTQVAHAGAGNSECTLWCSGRVVHALGGFPGFKKWLTSWLVGRVLAGLNRLSKTKNSHPRLQTSGWKCPWKCNRRVGKGLVFNPTSHSFVSFQHGPS